MRRIRIRIGGDEVQDLRPWGILGSVGDYMSETRWLMRRCKNDLCDRLHVLRETAEPFESRIESMDDAPDYSDEVGAATRWSLISRTVLQQEKANGR